MAQFDVHKARGTAARFAPYLLVLQADALANLNTVIVAPMRPAGRSPLIVKHLHVIAEFLSARHVVFPEELVSLPRQALGAKAGSLTSARQELTAALDFLFYGF